MAKPVSVEMKSNLISSSTLNLNTNNAIKSVQVLYSTQIPFLLTSLRPWESNAVQSLDFGIQSVGKRCIGLDKKYVFGNITL